MNSLTAAIEHLDDETRIILVGLIDETAEPLMTRALSDLRRKVRIDFEGVTRINSYGVGLMMRGLSAIPNHHTVEFERCSEALVDQFQMLNFSGFGRITSFYVRFLCERCQRETSRLIVVKRDITVVKGEVETLPVPCICGGKLMADDPLDFVVDHF